MENKTCIFVRALLVSALTFSTGLSFAQTHSTSADNTSKSSLIKQLEEEREQKLEDERNKTEQRKIAAKRDTSPDCQFWRLQKIKKPTPKADEKIKQYCGEKLAQETH